MRTRIERGALRRVAGAVWLTGWILVLWAVAAPWRGLGGEETELLRWLEAAVLGTGLVAGFLIGTFARDAALSDPRRTHARLLRIVLYPPAILTAGSLIALAFVGKRGPAAVVATAFLAYWAGLDLAFGAVPLLDGRSYRFDRPLEGEESAPDDEERWVPPWERP